MTASSAFATNIGKGSGDGQLNGDESYGCFDTRSGCFRSRMRLMLLQGNGTCSGRQFILSATLDDLSQKLSLVSVSPVRCDALMTRRPLLEPGILATYINAEQDALEVTARSHDPGAWWHKNEIEIKKRWNHELGLSSDSVFQQTIMICDLTLLNWPTP